MEGLSRKTEGALVRGLDRYLKDTHAAELPSSLRRYQKLGFKTLLQHKDALLGALDDADLRADVIEWLDELKPKLKGGDGPLLRLAVERPEGWEEELRSAEEPAEAADGTSDRIADLERRLQKERDKTRKARDEARRAKEEAKDQAESARARIRTIESQLKETDRALTGARDRTEAAEAEAEAARTRLETELRKAKKQVAEAQSERDKAKADRKAAHRDVEELRKQVLQLEERVTVQSRQLERAKAPAPAPGPVRKPRKRKVLPAPLGLREDDPQTLVEWLSTEGVSLLVDGYNVTKAEGGYGEVDLETQRDRLVQDVSGLATRTEVDTTVIFDGSVVHPGTKRNRRGRVKIEYSRPGEIADDHLIALLQGLPPDPVIVATNDRELQGRAVELGATVATSDQLLGLIR